ncbi:MAG TPA: hypothetical protein VIL42_04880 [Sphingomicrobium sp.]|jgi:hypothetical protein
MTSQESGEAQPRSTFSRELKMLFVIWLVVALAKTVSAFPDLSDRTFPDPDDAMRLLQVRDWLAGQSWFDVSQHRLNPPYGGPMHWSRFVDLPIAAVVLLFRPFVGQYHAETAALVIVPMLTLGAAMVLVYRIALRLGTPRMALLATIGAPASLGAMTQMRSMRIDHHGWQIVLALVVVLAALDGNKRRSGLLAGVGIGLWLNISVEALPFAVAVAALFALQWLLDATATERLKAYLLSLAASASLLFGATHLPATWGVIHHDSLNGGHLAAFAAAALCGLLVIRSGFEAIRRRFAALAAIAVLATAAIFSVDPHFIKPFDALDPLVTRMWYNAVDEGQPVWNLAFKDMAVAMSQQVVGLAAALFAMWKTEGEERRLWGAFAFLLGAATLVSIAVTREATLASVVSLPGTAFLCDFALSRARAVPRMPKRVLATAGALCIMAPAYAVPAATMPQDPDSGNEPDFGAECARQSEITHLNALPASIIASPLDITPAIIAETPHTAIGSGHHRNVTGIRDMIMLFVGPEKNQHEIIARRHIRYVVFCPGTAEAGWWAGNGPKGLAAALSKGKAPSWLAPVKIDGLKFLRVWEVKPRVPVTAKG